VIALRTTDATLFYVTASDGDGAYVQDAWTRNNSGLTSCWSGHRSNASSGSHTVTATSTGGTAANTFGAVALLEVSGLALGCFDQAIWAQANSTGPIASGSTGTLATSNSLVIAATQLQAAWLGFSPPPTGGPGTYTALISDSGQRSDLDYQVIASSTAAVSASWGSNTNSGRWSALCAVYSSSAATGPAIVNTSGPYYFNQSNPSTAVATLNRVTAGNAIIVLSRHWDQTGGFASWTISDGTSYTADVSQTSGSPGACAIHSLFNASGGTHTITATCSTDTANSYGSISAFEVANINVFDKGSNNRATSTTPTTGTTGTLTSATCIYFTILRISDLLSNGITVPPTGGPAKFYELWDGQGDLTFGASATFAWQDQTSGTTGVSAAWGTNGTSQKWEAVIGVYRMSSASPNSFPFRRKGRIFLPVTYSR
jgi:hypothetical protein